MAARSVVYVPCDPPRRMGEYRGKPIFLYGAHRIRLEDGFTLMSPHTAVSGTISVEPPDLDAEPHFVELLFEQAERARDEALKRLGL